MKKGFPRDSRAISSGETRSFGMISAEQRRRELAGFGRIDLADLHEFDSGRARNRSDPQKRLQKVAIERVVAPISSDQHQRGRVRGTQQFENRRGAVPVSPLHIVDEQDEGRAIAEPRQQLAESPECPAPQLLGIRDLRKAPPRSRDGLDLSQDGKDAREHDHIPRKQGLRLGEREPLQVLAQRIDQAVESLVGDRFALVTAPCENHGVRLADGDLVEKPPDEGGLAHSGRPADVDRDRSDPPSPRERLAEARRDAMHARQKGPRGRSAASTPPRRSGDRRGASARISSSPGRRSGSRRRSARHSPSRSSGHARHQFARSAAVPRRCFSTRTSRNSPRNGRSPVRASKRMTPTLYQSLGSERGRPAACSGDMYAGVPTRWRLASCSGPKSDTRPKSSRTTRPCRVTRTLEGLMSRCSLRARWSAWSPSASSRRLRRSLT